MNDEAKSVREWTEEERRQLRIMNLMKSLITHEGFTELKRLVNEQARHHHTKVLQPAEDLSGLWRSEYEKGAVYGLTQAIQLPETIIQTVKEAILRDNPEGDDDV